MDAEGPDPVALNQQVAEDLSAVIPGRAEGANPESRKTGNADVLDSGFARFASAPE
jgi:hypothetical protein